MGGDHGFSVVLPAAVNALKRHADLKIILVGNQKILEPALQRLGVRAHERLEIQHASEQVAMDESPSVALRTKKDSSMRVAINLVKEGRAQACVSAGNTGALVGTARFVLKTLPGIDRPVIVSALPTRHELPVYMLDLGANVDTDHEDLFQFAVMGSVLAEHVRKIKNPRIGLLNIGEEVIKGNELVKQAAQRLAATKPLNYIGFVEGKDIFEGTADVVVCDGFVGNVALKTSEGAAKLVVYMLKQAFTRNSYTKLIALVAKPILRYISKKLDPSQYNGASLLGLNGIVIKSHGDANVKAFLSAIDEAVLEIDKNIPQRIGSRIAELLGSDE